MVDSTKAPQVQQGSGSYLDGPSINPEFVKELDQLVALGKQGHRSNSEYFNPSNEWLLSNMRIFQELPEGQKKQILEEATQLALEAEKANAAGKAASRAWPDAVVRLNHGGLAFFSQLGVVRRPDLTQYFIDGFLKNRDALAFSEESQALFAEVFRYITNYMKEKLGAGETIIQSDRQICDAAGRSFHARQMLFGDHYLQAPYMWRQLTFDLPESDLQKTPDILEISIPNWMEDIRIPEDLKSRVKEAGLAQLIFKAPTRGLSLHLGFDYVGEHKMGPLSIAMFLVKQQNGIAIQAALSMARARTISGNINNIAMLTVGPSLHGKSTLTTMIEFANSELAKVLGLPNDSDEGVYPMNDDIILLQPLAEPKEIIRGGHRVRISHGIDGTENNFYAMPAGLTQEEDPITYDVVRGATDAPNPQETLENVPVNVEQGVPDFVQNPVRNMRAIVSRRRLLARKGTEHVIEAITGGSVKDSVHVPMEYTDRVFWQAVMRQNTVIAPLRRLTLEQYIRVLMYGEAVQMGAATGAIGRPYVEYFSDPFIIGLEDENANLMHYILQQIGRGGLQQEYYVFNTGGVGAETNDEASGPRYKKIPRELTLMLQEAVLREAVKFEYDSNLGSDVAVAIVNSKGEEVVNLRNEWLPRQIYGDDEYARRVVELRRRRYYSRDSKDKAGILRYTKVIDALIDLSDIPPPTSERELAWLLSFYWHVDRSYDSLEELADHSGEGQCPVTHLLRALRQKYYAGRAEGLNLSDQSEKLLFDLGILGVR